MAPGYSDLAEHISTIVSLLALVAMLAGFFFWKLISKNLDETKELGKKMDNWNAIHTLCREKQEEERAVLLTKVENAIGEIKKERKSDWKHYFWPHIHDQEGSVKVPRTVNLEE